jgi:protein-ribulosamine 3-kinase
MPATVKRVVRPPAGIVRGVSAALGGRRIEAVRGVGGGCISPAARIQAAGDAYFLKWSDGTPPRYFFREEARSLRALDAAHEVRVPRVVASDECWLLLEWLEPGHSSGGAWRALGLAVARMHRHRAEAFGWAADNYIGTLAQANAWLRTWPEFWRERRLRPQLERALHSGLLAAQDEAGFEALFEQFDTLLADAAEDGPSLLHGDLWGGNVHMGTEQGALIDPSSYYGHREVDLAMARLFGGFDAAFFDGYEAEWPTLPDAGGKRMAAYQLYYLLVHVNLFGAGYLAQTRDALRRALG